MRTRRNLVTGIAPAALALVLASGAALTASAGGGQPAGRAWSVPGPAGRPARFVDQHGPVLRAPQLYLIYWGTAWMPQTAATPTPAEVNGAVRTLMASGYLTGLTQYRGSGHGALRGSALITSSDPPDGFTDHQVAAFINAPLSAGAVPGPDPGNQTVYGVVMPTWVTPEFTGWAGEHNSYPRSGQKIHYAWFTNFGYLGSITAIISHELVESATDPDGSGFLGLNRTCHGPGWCEIADICESTWASIDGITVHAYWSNQANACIAPSSRRRIAADSSGGTPARHDAVSARHAPASTSVLGRGTSPRSSGTSSGRPGIPPGHSGRRRTRHGPPTSGTLPRSSGTSCCTPGTGPGAGKRPRGAGRARAAGTRWGAGPRLRAMASTGFRLQCGAVCLVRLASRERVRSASTTIRRSW